jgi:hypothetical protein
VYCNVGPEILGSSAAKLRQMSESSAQEDRPRPERRQPRWLWVLLVGYAIVVASSIADLVTGPSFGRIAIDLLGVASVGFAGWFMWRSIQERKARGLSLGPISMMRHDFSVFRKDNLRMRITEAASGILTADERVVATAFAGLNRLGTLPTFLTLTDRRLIAQRASLFTLEAEGVLFADSRDDVSVVKFKRRLWPGSFLWVQRSNGEILRFIFPNLPARWRRDAERLRVELGSSPSQARA